MKTKLEIQCALDRRKNDLIELMKEKSTLQLSPKSLELDIIIYNGYNEVKLLEWILDLKQ